MKFINVIEKNSNGLTKNVSRHSNIQLCLPYTYGIIIWKVRCNLPQTFYPLSSLQRRQATLYSGLQPISGWLWVEAFLALYIYVRANRRSLKYPFDVRLTNWSDWIATEFGMFDRGYNALSFYATIFVLHGTTCSIVMKRVLIIYSACDIYVWK